ncbi:hypothetical protein ACFP1Z_21425 [Streptomyces gamaensis]|uniref:Uncharacterized protein n=1 Tax=Streptomyces gamaensis TaxID=1763542 RepID=A0ABW0Z5F7_9ACTN
METIPNSCGGAASQRDMQPAYVVLGRHLAITGLALLLPAFLLLAMTDVTKQISHDHCYYEGCTKPLMAALDWAWRMLYLAGAAALVAVCLPRRVARLRFCLACLQLLLLVSPFFIVAGV